MYIPQTDLKSQKKQSTDLNYKETGHLCWAYTCNEKRKIRKHHLHWRMKWWKRQRKTKDTILDNLTNWHGTKKTNVLSLTWNHEALGDMIAYAFEHDTWDEIDLYRSPDPNWGLSLTQTNSRQIWYILMYAH